MQSNIASQDPRHGQEAGSVLAIAWDLQRLTVDLDHVGRDDDAVWSVALPASRFSGPQERHPARWHAPGLTPG